MPKIKSINRITTKYVRTGIKQQSTIHLAICKLIRNTKRKYNFVFAEPYSTATEIKEALAKDIKYKPYKLCEHCLHSSSEQKSNLDVTPVDVILNNLNRFVMKEAGICSVCKSKPAGYLIKYTYGGKLFERPACIATQCTDFCLGIKYEPETIKKEEDELEKCIADLYRRVPNLPTGR